MNPQKIIISQKQIAERVAELGAEITSYYQNQPLTIVSLMYGASIFTADLVRQIKLENMILDSMRVSSYQNDKSTGTVRIAAGLKLPVAGRHVLLVDDIVDTGRTLQTICAYIEKRDVLSVRTCVLLKK